MPNEIRPAERKEATILKIHIKKEKKILYLYTYMYIKVYMHYSQQQQCIFSLIYAFLVPNCTLHVHPNFSSTFIALATLLTYINQGIHDSIIPLIA